MLAILKLAILKLVQMVQLYCMSQSSSKGEALMCSVAPQVEPETIILWGLRVRMAIATGAVENVKVVLLHLQMTVMTTQTLCSGINARYSTSPILPGWSSLAHAATCADHVCA